MEYVSERIWLDLFQVGVSDDLYHFIHDLWLENQPIGELSWQSYALDAGSGAPGLTLDNEKSNKSNGNVIHTEEIRCSPAGL